jgi:hypothetical protein
MTLTGIYRYKHRLDLAFNFRGVAHNKESLPAKGGQAFTFNGYAVSNYFPDKI